MSSPSPAPSSVEANRSVCANPSCATGNPLPQGDHRVECLKCHSVVYCGAECRDVHSLQHKDVCHASGSQASAAAAAPSPQDEETLTQGVETLLLQSLLMCLADSEEAKSGALATIERLKPLVIRQGEAAAAAAAASSSPDEPSTSFEGGVDFVKLLTSDTVAKGVYISHVLGKLYENYPNNTPKDLAQYEQLISREKSIWPDTILPIMCIKAPLSIVKIYVEKMEQMIAHDNAEKALGRPASHLVNEQKWPFILSNFLTTAMCLNPSEEVLRFLIKKGAKLPDEMIAALNASDKTPEGVITVLKNFTREQVCGEEVDDMIALIRSEKTKTDEEQDAEIAQMTAQTEAQLSKFQPNSLSAEAIRLIFIAASRPPLAEGTGESFSTRSEVERLHAIVTGE